MIKLHHTQWGMLEREISCGWMMWSHPYIDKDVHITHVESGPGSVNAPNIIFKEDGEIWLGLICIVGADYLDKEQHERFKKMVASIYYPQLTKIVLEEGNQVARGILSLQEE